MSQFARRPVIPRCRRVSSTSTSSRLRRGFNHAAACNNAMDITRSSTASSPIHFFDPNFAPVDTTLREEEQLRTALVALQLSPTFTPYLHGAHILQGDSRAILASSSSEPLAKIESQKPAASQPEPEDSEGHISDQEWEIRTGSLPSCLLWYHVSV